MHQQCVRPRTNNASLVYKLWTFTVNTHLFAVPRYKKDETSNQQPTEDSTMTHKPLTKTQETFSDLISTAVAHHLGTDEAWGLTDVVCVADDMVKLIPMFSGLTVRDQMQVITFLYGDALFSAPIPSHLSTYCPATEGA